MLKISRIVRDYREAGSVNELLALWGFVDGETFLTKAGHVGVVYSLAGMDVEGLSHTERRSLVHRLEAGLRLLDDRCRLYQYVVKRVVAPFTPAHCDQPIAQEAIQRRAEYLNGRRSQLFELALFAVLIYEAPTVTRTRISPRGLLTSPREVLHRWLSTDRACAVLESELDRAIAALQQKAQAFEVQLSELGLRRLPKRDAFRFFRQLVNYDEAVVDSATLAYDTHLDYFAADSAIECDRDHLTIGRRRVKVLSMKEPPTQTFSHVLGDLFEIPGEFVACLEWQRLPNDRMRRDLQTRRRHWHRGRSRASGRGWKRRSRH